VEWCSNPDPNGRGGNRAVVRVGNVYRSRHDSRDHMRFVVPSKSW
jgi:hypothetical protein